VEWRVIKGNPAGDVQKPKVISKEVTPYDEAEVGSFFFAEVTDRIKQLNVSSKRTFKERRHMFHLVNVRQLDGDDFEKILIDCISAIRIICWLSYI
jgi:hypothetical protein